jgi:peptide/nickel transport system permease protein
LLKLFVSRLIAIIPTLLIVTFGVFLLVKLVPTDPAVSIAGGISATQEDIAKVREQYHFNDSIPSQYWRWLSHAVTGDLGSSYISKTPVTDDLKNRIPVTFGLILAAIVFAVLVAIPFGILSGLRPNGVTDRFSRAYSSLAISIPSFLLATWLVIIFAVDLGWLPPSGYVKWSESPSEWLRYITLPAISLGVAVSASIMRQLRGALVDELDTNHIRTAWAIGGAPARVVGRHGLKNAASPAITILGLQIAALVGGTVIVENIFSIPGLGTYLLQAITSADIPVIQGCVLILAIMQITMGLLTDVSYALLNPKVRVT